MRRDIGTGIIITNPGQDLEGQYMPGRDAGRELAAALLDGKAPARTGWDIPADPADRLTYLLGLARGMDLQLHAAASGRSL